MGVVVGGLACAKVSSLRRGLPWTFGLRSKRPSTTGRSVHISLTAYLDRTGSAAQTGSGCALRMGKGSSSRSRVQSSATKSRKSPEKAASARPVPRLASSMTIARAFMTRSLGGFGSKPRACAAVPAMRGPRRCPAGLFLRWPIFSQSGLPRSCSGSMTSLGLGIPFGKPRG